MGEHIDCRRLYDGTGAIAAPDERELNPGENMTNKGMTHSVTVWRGRKLQAVQGDGNLKKPAMNEFR